MKHWGRLPVIMLAVALIVLFCGCQKNRQPAITMIGGADGPTSIWVSALGLPGGRTLEHEDIGFFTVREVGNDVAMLEISGMCMSSALAVKSVRIKRKRDSLAVYLKTSLCVKEGDSGTFRYEISIPADVNRVVLGTRAKEIWRRADKLASSPAKSEALKVTVEIRNNADITDRQTITLTDAESLHFSKIFSNMRTLEESDTLRLSMFLDGEEGTLRKFYPKYLIKITDGEEIIMLKANDLIYAKVGTSMGWKWNDDILSILKNLGS